MRRPKISVGVDLMLKVPSSETRGSEVTWSWANRTLIQDGKATWRAETRNSSSTNTNSDHHNPYFIIEQLEEQRNRKEALYPGSSDSSTEGTVFHWPSQSSATITSQKLAIPVEQRPNF